MALSKITVYKQPAEVRRVSMDFSNKMATTESIASILSVTQSKADGSATTDLTFSDQTFSAQVAQMLISGGTIPNRDDINYCDYKVTVRVSTDDGQELENDGILRVQED